LSDLPRSIEDRIDKRPVISDLADVDGQADLVLFLYRDYVYNGANSLEPEVAEVIVAKQRDGSPTGTIKLAFKNRTGKFEGLAPSKSSPVESP
jgi:replicative DNA helicase